MACHNGRLTIDGFLHTLFSESSVFNGQGFLSAWHLLKLRVNILDTSLGLIISLSCVLNGKWHLSVWCCLNLTGNDAVSCNVNLNFRILFPQWSYSTNDSPSKGCSLSMWIISLSWHTSSAVIAQEHLRSIRSPTPTSLFKGMIFSEIFWRWGQIRADSGLGMTLPSWYRGSWVAFGQTNFYIFVIAMYNKAFDPLAFDNLLWKDCW